MIRGMGFDRTTFLTGVALMCALVLVSPSAALADVPHVAVGPAPDTCAMCHRAHTAPGTVQRIDAESQEMTGSALALVLPSDKGDTELCYVCHGVDALGSGTPVGASFEETSVHTLAPTASPFGPSVKYCSSCHDAHGADKITTGTPYPALLRSRTSDGDLVFQGSAYCGTCHGVREESRFDGVAIYEQTGHYTALPDPASGTDIRCSICHAGHGSAIAPLINASITPPALAATATVTANDRTLCFACHDQARDTYPGEAAYEDSAHAASSAVTTIPGEWAADDAERRVGECQVCHAPMGRDDGTGAPIPTLLEIEGSALCLSCHDVDGPAATDLASLQYPAEAAAHLELVVGISPESTTSAFGGVAVWGTDAADAAPRSLVGPRTYVPSGTSGAVATGDVDGDGRIDVVVVDPGTHRLTVYIQDPLKGLTSFYGPGEVDLSAVDASLSGVTPDFALVADVFDDAGLMPELVLGDADTGDVYVLRWAEPPAVVTPGFELVYTASGVASSMSGMAAGDLSVPADGFAEVVVTDDDALSPSIVALTESGVTPDTFTTHFGPVAALAGVRGPSIGDAHPDAGIEVAVANSGEPAASAVSLYDASGTLIDDYAINAAAGAARDTLIADVWSGEAGAELAVAIDAGLGSSSINVYAQGGSDLAAPVAYATGTRYRTGSLAAGDLDGDGEAELFVGNGGFWSRDAAEATVPSVQVFKANGAGTAFDTAETVTLRFGGVERAGSAPWLAVADLGGVGPSRHPVGAVEDTHVPTETAPFVRHVECADCHNAHEATATPAAAPAAYGRILGTFGATATHTPAEPIANEYELCYKCHSAYQDATGLEGARDVSADFETGNASVHAVEQSVATTINAGAFVGAWDNDSVLYCIDCHAVAGSSPAVAGPHVSAEAPVLVSPYLGALPANADLLCYDCHRYTTYYDETGTGDAGAAASWFADATAGPLHGLHVRDHGFACATCHVSHGSPSNEALIRPVIDFVRAGAGGSCIGPCHPSPDGGITPGVVYAR